MNYDIVVLLSEIFNDAGMNSVIDPGLSNHSTITLNMKDDIPAINIKSEDDEFWIWAEISEHIPASFSYLSPNLIPVMLNHHESHFHLGQPCLYPINGCLELRAQIKDKHLQSSDEFLSMLDQFLTILQDYRFVLS